MKKLKEYFKTRLGHWGAALVYCIGFAAAGTVGTLGCFRHLVKNAHKYNATAFEFDVKKNAAAGLSLTSLAIAFTVFDFYLLSYNWNVCVTPITIACGSLAVFSGVALYIALPGEPIVQVLVASQAMAVGVQLGAIANVGRFNKEGEAKATELSANNFELKMVLT